MAKLLSPQVFFHSGVDISVNFIVELSTALRDGGICVFDSYGEIDFQTFFEQHTEDPKIVLAIFTKGYSQSEEDLNELVKIMEKVEENKLKVIPIFFKVKVEDVKYQMGEFGRNLYGGGDPFGEEDPFGGGFPDRSDMPKWVKALQSVTDIKGLCRADYRWEMDLIPDIVLAVKKVIANISPVSGGEEGTKMLYTNISSVSRPQQHQIFINFRGEQLRNNFVSHLVDALRRNEINVFIDKQENKGENISNLLKRIEDSRIAIVVFSSKYTESLWCLREAEKIMERAAQDMLKVLPIFYKVTPTNVKLLQGEFGDNFKERELESRHEKAVIEKWKEALVFISNKLGFPLDEKSDETDFISSIVNEVLKMLTSIPLATQPEESHTNPFSYKGETSNSASYDISSGTAQSNMNMSTLARLFNYTLQEAMCEAIQFWLRLEL